MTSYHIHRGGETQGPYRREDLDALARGGQLADDDMVWDDAAGQWITWRDFRGEAAPAAAEKPRGALYPCRDHVDQSAVGVCSQCGALLCPQCLRPGERAYLCPRCADALGATPVDAVQESIDRVLGAAAARPRIAAAVVFAVAIALFLLFGGSAAGRGIDAIESNLLWMQAQRALERASFLAEQGETTRAQRWYELAQRAAGRLTRAESIAPALREQAFMFEMRADLDLEKYADLHDDLGRYADAVKSPTRESDYAFFQGCDAYLRAQDYPRAIQFLRQVEMPGIATDIGVTIDIMSQKTPEARSAAMALNKAAFTSAELGYRLGYCYVQAGKLTDAYYRLKNAATAQDEMPGDRKWRELAAKLLATVPEPKFESGNDFNFDFGGF